MLVPAEVRAIRELLSPAELLLFAAMEPRDRRHSVNVLRYIEARAEGEAPSKELRAAALLHDAGKGPLLALERVAYVLLEAVSPRLVEAIGRPEGPRWRQGLWRLRHHAGLGANLLMASGSSPRVVSLVARHLEGDPASDEELRLLREADRAC